MTRPARAAPLLLAALAACYGCAGRSRPAPASPTDAAPALGTVALRVLHFGDFGDATRQQAQVARALAERSRRAPLDMALAAGDNIYECGPDTSLPGAEACAFGPDGATVPPDFAPPADPSFVASHEAPAGAAPPGRRARPGLPRPREP